MKDCDRLFDLLTQSRFDDNVDDDSVVIAHLHQCPACRELADSIHPAVDLFRASFPNDPDSEVGESRTMAHVSRRIKNRGIVTTYSVSLLLLIGIFLTLHGSLAEPTNSTSAPLSSSYAELSPVTYMPDRQMLAALELPVGCVAEPPNNDEALQCCTECHSATASSHINQAFALLVSSCSACHSLN